MKTAPVAVVVLLTAFAAPALGTEQTFEGIFVKKFERSDFYAGGDGSKRPYWLKTSDELHNKMGSDGFFSYSHDSTPWAGLKNPAVRVKFVGDLSKAGRYGHLDKYGREVTVYKVLEMSAVEGCR